MSFPFEPQQGLIIIRAELWGPCGSAVLRLALDTGATGTVVNVGMLVAVGYDPALVPDRIQVTTGSGVEFLPRVILDKLEALGQKRTGFPVLCHTLPPSAASALRGVHETGWRRLRRGGSRRARESCWSARAAIRQAKPQFSHKFAITGLTASFVVSYISFSSIRQEKFRCPDV